jgi:hypothetical protein
MVLVAVVALAFAGCGGGGGSSGGGDRLSKSEYEHEMQGIGKDLQEASSGVDLSDTKDLDSVADTVGKFKTKLEDAADKVDNLNPPADAEEDNNKIADALHAFADEFGNMEKAARDGNLGDLQKAQQAVVSEGAEASKAAEDLKKKGYNIGDLSG